MRKVILILVLVFMLLALCGCSIEVIDNTNNVNKEERFIKISDTNIDANNYTIIFYDKKTKIQYLFVEGYKAGGLTILLNSDGTPLLYEGE